MFIVNLPLTRAAFNDLALSVFVRVCAMSICESRGKGRLLARLLLTVGSAALLAACASDTSRFAEGSFTGADPVITNSTPSAGNDLPPPQAIAGGGVAPAASFPASGVAASPAITSSPLPPVASAASARAARPNPSFAAPATPSPRLAARPAATAAAATASLPTGTARNLARSGNWTPTGGTPITMAQGETAQMLSNRYGVPVSALVAVNGLKSASDLKPGMKLTVPVYDASSKIAGGTTGSIAPAAAGVAGAAALAGAAAVATRAASKPAPKPAASPQIAAATPAAAASAAAQPAREAKAQAAREAKEAAAKAAREKEEKAKQAKIAETKRREAEQARLREAKRKQQTAQAPAQSAETEEPAAEAARPRSVQQAARPAPSSDDTTGSVERETPAKPAGAKPEFRWPARGRIIQSYRKGNNDGINIAVPEGTAVKAAEAGTVAYAGSELRGYGNLVLIRHPNGYVSAYAHNGELNVKRGDAVRRGQTIAKSGRSGNVSSPQLHFELRQGSTPVDPTEYLAGN